MPPRDCGIHAIEPQYTPTAKMSVFSSLQWSIYMVNLYATKHRWKIPVIFLSFLMTVISFSLNFKQLICLIKKFRLSLRFYIDNIFDL